MREFLPGKGAYGFAFTQARISDEMVVGVFFVELNIRTIDQGNNLVIDTFRLCSAPVDVITYASSGQPLYILTPVTWTGGGDLLEISTITETTSLQANGVSIKISGFNTSLISEALTNPVYPNSVCNVYYAPYQIKVQENITTGTTTISTTDSGEPPLFFSGLLDTMQIVDSGDSATLSLNLESRLSTFDRSKPNRFTYENQKDRGSNSYLQSTIDIDHALAHVTEVQRKVLKWGT